MAVKKQQEHKQNEQMLLGVVAVLFLVAAVLFLNSGYFNDQGIAGGMDRLDRQVIKEDSPESLLKELNAIGETFDSGEFTQLGDQAKGL